MAECRLTQPGDTRIPISRRRGRILLEDLRSVREEDEERDTMFVASYVNNRIHALVCFHSLCFRFASVTAHAIFRIRSPILYHNIIDGRPRCRM